MGWAKSFSFDINAGILKTATETETANKTRRRLLGHAASSVVLSRSLADPSISSDELKL